MGKVLTLLYHRVNVLERDIHLLAVSPDHFYEQMVWLKRNFRIVRFEDDWDRLEGEAVCITFDDGYMDNFSMALPILEELNIPATIFICTGSINTENELWWDELERYLLDEEKHYPENFYLQDDFFGCGWATKTYRERRELYDTMHWLMYNKIDVKKRLEWMKQLKSWSGCSGQGRTENCVLQTDTGQKYLSPLLTIGAHTQNHPSLKSLPRQQQYSEMAVSQSMLSTLFERKITVFSYPFGGKGDYDETTIEICRELGFYKAAANYPAIWSPGCDPFQIPRHIIRDWGKEEFVKKVGETLGDSFVWNI